MHDGVLPAPHREEGEFGRSLGEAKSSAVSEIVCLKEEARLETICGDRAGKGCEWLMFGSWLER